jgi:hypothetical protein
MTEPESSSPPDKEPRKKLKPLPPIATGAAVLKSAKALEATTLSAKNLTALAASAKALEAATLGGKNLTALAASAKALEAATLGGKNLTALAASAKALEAATPSAATLTALAGSMKALKAFTDVAVMRVKLPPPIDVGRIDQLVSAIALARFPTWALDRSLIRSGLDTATIHTPAFAPTPPAAKPTPSQAESAQRRLLDAFDSLLKFEFEMRDLISKRLSAVAGSKWWKQRVPSGVIEDCQTRKDEKERPGSGVAHHPIFYAYPDDYRKIILRQDNWDECFEQVFKHKIEINAFFLWIGAARPEIAHARPLGDAAFTKFTMAVRWIINAIDLVDGRSSK